MRKGNGFTIVELVVATAVIVIIATITTLTYTNVQKDSRDSKKLASATSLAESLERYFERNGEYPTVATVTNPNATTVKQTLDVTTLSTLLGPTAAAGSNVNVWKTGNATSSNQFTYSPNTDNSDSCKTLSTAADACIDYKIQYYKEKTGTVETITSRYKAVVATTPPVTPPPVTVNPPSTPTITAALSGSNAVGTRSNATCATSVTAQYAFRSRTNDGAWGAYSGWDSTTTTVSAAAAQGSKYGFQVKAKCVDGTAESSEVTSTEATYIRQVSAPTMTALTNSTSGNNTTWSWPAVACPAGTTATYAVNRGTDFDTTGAIGWLGWTADQSGTTWVRDTTSQGYEYTAVVRAKCGSAYHTSVWSAESNYSKYLRPVTAPGGAYNWSYGIYSSRTIYRWTWTAPACGLGTTQSYQWDNYIGDVNNANGWNMYWSDKGPYNRYWYGATAPSRQDTNWYDTPQLDMDYRGSSTPGGIDVYARIKHRCQNPATLRSAEGSWTQSPNYWT